jgi:WD40 repeat protein
MKQSPFSNKAFVVTCSSDALVKIWNISNPIQWSLIQTYTHHWSQVFGVEFINEDTIASSALDNSIRLWSIKTGLTTKTISTNYNVYSLQLLSNGLWLAVMTDSGHRS